MLRWLWRRRRVDEETRAEMESHLEMLTGRYIRLGLSPEDARRAALRQFGSVTWHREEIHMMNGVRWMDELLQDLRSAGRSIRRRPTLAASITVTLALGIGSNTAMFSVIDATLLRPLPYRSSDRVVFLRSSSVEDKKLSDPTIEDLQRWDPLLTSFERVEARRWKSVLLTGDEGATRVRMLEVSTGYLDTVGSRILAGRGLHPDDARPGATPVVLVSERLWRNRYAAHADLIGRTIDVDATARIVVGITTDFGSDIPGLRFAVFGPLPAAEEGRKTTALGVGWLKEGVTVEAARAELESVSASVDARGRPTIGALERPSNIFWKARGFRDPQLALMLGVFLLLLIACVNVASLLLGAGRGRAMELAVRRALGASRLRVARLLMVESLVLAAAGGALGLLFAWAALQYFVTLDPGPQLQAQLETTRLDALVVGYTMVIAVLTAAVFGIVPALRGSSTQPRTSLHEGGGRWASESRAWPRMLVALEVALSLVLLISAGLVARAFLQMRLADPGFAADRVLGVQIALPSNRYQTPERRAAFFDELRARALRLPGVKAAGLGYGALPPSDFVADGPLETDEGQRLEDAWISLSHVGPGHFELMGIPMIAGNGFDEHHLKGSSVPEIPAVISQSLRLQFWAGANPVGSGFRLTTPRGVRRYRIIGVAGDASGGGLAGASCQKCRWQMYVPLPDNRQYTEVLLRLADGAPPPTTELRAAIAQIDPGVPSDERLETAAASLHGFLDRPRFRAALFGGLAALAIMLVAFGLLAVVFHSVKQRTREIGIRMALGARPAQMRRQILIQGLGPVMAGVLAGLLGALLVTRMMGTFLLGISPTDPFVFVGSPALLVIVSFAAILVPVLQATRVNPVDVLRSE